MAVVDPGADVRHDQAAAFDKAPDGLGLGVAQRLGARQQQDADRRVVQSPSRTMRSVM